ncbi:MAG: RNA pyrophosphohydrolase [Gammaproteobacteria bacterium]|nr:RNA pyrophosphohydrolase [Gammaproteobacteria bacterium]
MRDKYKEAMLDDDGYRPNVGIILCNCRTQVLWARRAKHDGWQFPQGGVKPGESAEQALYRELYEEVGLRSEHVRVMGRTQHWLRYELPRRYLRNSRLSGFKGQKQIWFLLQLITEDSQLCLNHSRQPEFDDWRWIDYWAPIGRIVDFKRQVYKCALTELEPLLGQVANSAYDSGQI